MKWLFGTRTPLIVINHGLVSWFINPGLTFMVVNGGYSCRNSFFDGIHMNPANFDILHALRGFAREAPIQPYPVFWIRRTLRWTRNLDMFHCVFKALRWFFFGFNSIFGFPVPEIWWLSQFSSSVEALETSSWWLQIPEIPWRKADRRSRSTQIDVPIFSETDLRCRCKFMSKCSQHGTYWDILGHIGTFSGNFWQFLDDDMSHMAILGWWYGARKWRHVSIQNLRTFDSKTTAILYFVGFHVISMCSSCPGFFFPICESLPSAPGNPEVRAARCLAALLSFLDFDAQKLSVWEAAGETWWNSLVKLPCLINMRIQWCCLKWLLASGVSISRSSGWWSTKQKITQMIFEWFTTYTL